MTLKVTLLTLALIAFMGAAPSNARSIYVVDANHEKVTAIDLDTIQRDGTLVSVWSIQGFRQPRNFLGDVVDYSYVHFSFDCVAERQRITSLSTYREGKILKSFSRMGDWSDIIPESILQKAEKLSCSPVKPAGGIDVESSKLLQVFRAGKLD